MPRPTLRQQNEQLHRMVTAMAQLLHTNPPEGYSPPYVAISMMSGRTEELTTYLEEQAKAHIQKAQEKED